MPKSRIVIVVLSALLCEGRPRRGAAKQQVRSKAKHSRKDSVIVCMFYRGFGALGFSLGPIIKDFGRQISRLSNSKFPKWRFE